MSRKSIDAFRCAFILRFFLAIFLLQWSIEKLILSRRGCAHCQQLLRTYRDRNRELAAAIRPMGTGQDWQPYLDFDMANLGRLCGALPHAGMGYLDH